MSRKTGEIRRENLRSGQGLPKVKTKKEKKPAKKLPVWMSV